MKSQSVFWRLYEPGADNYFCHTIVWWVQKYTWIEWERCVFAKCRAPLKNATQCLSPRLSPVEKNSGGEEGYDDFGATTKQPRPRAARLLKRLCRLRMFYARFATNSNGSWFKHIMVIAPARARSSARTWRVLAMSKILWTKQRLVAGRTLSQLVEGWLYYVVYPHFVYRHTMILSKAHVTLTMWFGKKNVQFWEGNQKIY